MTNDVDLYYETHGHGMPLMLVAGLASDSQSWQTIVGSLADHYLVIAPDNRWVGRTHSPDGEMTIPQAADDCRGLIRHLGLSSVNLLGHSMGGLIAMDLAIRHPECVTKLILAGTSSRNSLRNNSLFLNWAACLDTGLAPHLWFREIFYWLFSTSFFENEAAVEEAVRFAVEYPYPQSAAGFRHQVEAIADYDCTEALSQIVAKTLVIAGEEDLLFPPRVGTGLAQGIPEAAFTVIQGAAHGIHVEQPGQFSARVVDFLARH